MDAYKAEARELVNIAYAQLPPDPRRPNGPRLGYVFDEPYPEKMRKAMSIAGLGQKLCPRVAVKQARPQAPRTRVRADPLCFCHNTASLLWSQYT